MANNYMEFSEAITSLTSEEIKWIEENVKEDSALFADHDAPRFISEIDNATWWLHSNESFDPTHVACAVQAFLKRFRPNQYFTMTWAEYCDKHHIGVFGGGWMVITADDIKDGSTWSAIDAKCKELPEDGRKLANSA